MLSWEWGTKYLQAGLTQSLWLAGLLVVLHLVLRFGVRRFPAAQSFTREFAVLLLLRAMWQFTGRHLRTGSEGAFDRAELVQRLQDRLHLPDERHIQSIALAHPWIAQGLNLYYASMHLDGMIALMVWIWWKRRSSFRTARNTLVLTTFACLLLQMIPVAPPRLMAGAGFVDTGLRFGQSVYGPYGAGLEAQLTAMPSLHVAWAFIVAWYVLELGRGPWRWLGCAHLVVTFVVITGTANHWWLDGVVAILVVLAVLGVQAGAARLRDRAGGRPAPDGDLVRPGRRPVRPAPT